VVRRFGLQEWRLEQQEKSGRQQGLDMYDELAESLQCITHLLLTAHP